jgi:hypothetical protein
VGGRRRLLEQAAARAGLKLEVEAGLDLELRDTGPRRPWILGGRGSALEAVEEILEASWDSWDMILEEGILRIVSREAAVRFWRGERAW